MEYVKQKKGDSPEEEFRAHRVAETVIAAMNDEEGSSEICTKSARCSWSENGVVKYSLNDEEIQ
jgi:hypothetical protein